MSGRGRRIVLIDPAAKAEIARAAATYESARPGLADAVLDEFERVCHRIEAFPEGCQEADRQARRALMHRFPYSVIYHLSADAIRIVAVFPTRADPSVVSQHVSDRIRL